ncbi:MAG: S49 family peptidase [Candidatus Sumerlaeia bacterium]
MPNWNDVLRELQQFEINNARRLDIVRRGHLENLFRYTNRNVIVYYSGYMSKPAVPQSDINDEDKNGFMMAVHRMNRSLGLDLILHTPGGSIAATQSIVHYLHWMFKDNIRAIIPQQAMSAGTMMACSCKEILLAKHSNLGPIDPHLRGIPAYGIIQEFKRACREVKKDRSITPIWQAIIQQYRPSFLSQCEQAIKWSNSFVENELVDNMLQGVPDARTKAKKIVKALSNYRDNKAHERHLHFEECKKLGLKVGLIEDDPNLQDLILTVHHCFMHVLMNTPAYKMIENHMGITLVKNAAQQ